MSAPLNNNIAAVAPEQFQQAYLPRVQLALRLLLAALAVSYCWQLPLGTALFPARAVAAGALVYLLAQGLLSVPGPRLWGNRPALTLAMTGLDVLAALAVLGNDPAPCPPSAVLLLGILALALSRQRWPGYALLTGLVLLLGGATLTLRQQWLHLPYNSGFYMLLLFIAACAGVLLLLASQLEQLHQRTARVTDLDPLTGLGNRWTFYEAAKYLLPYRQRNLIPMVVMFADLELVADQTRKPDRRTEELLVRQFAAISEQRLRTSDVAVHYGHTTFAYLLIDTTLQAAEAIAGDLRQAFERWAQENRLPAHAHVGIANMPDDAVALDQILMNINASLQRSRQYRRGAAATVFTDPEQQNQG